MGNVSHFDVEGLRCLRGFLTPIHAGMNVKHSLSCQQPNLHQQIVPRKRKKKNMHLMRMLSRFSHTDTLLLFFFSWCTAGKLSGLISPQLFLFYLFEQELKKNIHLDLQKAALKKILWSVSKIVSFFAF